MIETLGRSVVGQYNTRTVDWIAAFIVTEAMVDNALAKSPGRVYDEAARRAKARRNIAIGIRCGSYWPYFS